MASQDAEHRPRRHRVVVVALDDVVGFDLGVPAQVFGAARDAAGARLYEITTATEEGRPVRSGAGFQVLPQHGLEVLRTADTVVVPGVDAGPAVCDGVVSDAVATALRAAHARGARIVSICTGAAVLAAAGLLDGRTVTTHWGWVGRLGDLYPKVSFDPDVLFVDDGDVLTSAGVAAGVDLCLHIVRSDHGTEVANRAARRCVVPPWRDGGQAQFIQRPVPVATATGTAATRAWALERLADRISLVDLAGHARMSVRTFTRRFRHETGTSPTRWLLHNRIERARLLLETTDLNVDTVARDVGLGSASSLRQHLRTAIGVPPSAYRRTFHRAVPDNA